MSDFRSTTSRIQRWQLIIELKLYDAKIRAELKQAKVGLEYFEACAKKRKSRTEIDTVSALWSLKQQIEGKQGELQNAVDPKAAQQNRNRRGNSKIWRFT